MSMRFYLAPLRGLTDRVYRNAWTQSFSGIDWALAPYVQTIGGHQVKQTHLFECTPANNQLPTIPQIIGKNAQHFVDMALQLADTGNEQVNWNLGCPYPTMTQKQCGAGLLPHADRIDRFLDLIFSTLSLKISIKMRLGLTSSQEIIALIPILNRYPLDHITIHPRVGQQMYGGHLDLDTFSRCQNELKAPLIFNGDLNTVDHLRDVQMRFPQLYGFMLGRGLLANPFLLEEYQTEKPIPPAQKQERLKAFHALLLNGYCQRLSGQTHQLQRLLAHWEYLGQAVNGDPRVMKKLHKVKSLAHYQDLVQRILT